MSIDDQARADLAAALRRLLAAVADAILVGEALLKSADLAARLPEFKQA